MGARVIAMEDDEPEESVEPQRKSHASSSKDIDKVTDYAEEKEMDTNAVAADLREIQEAEAAAAALEIAKERELAAVKVTKEDIEVVAQELAITVESAERSLRENKGDLRATLLALCRS